ncbi:hypothetical protein [Lacipirellula sp.]|uniref:hypothetical protein n=1 Tax=Lacipirellula sp. TaxID=2691419 RepID=UPI003D10EFC1
MTYRQMLVVGCWIVVPALLLAATVSVRARALAPLVLLVGVILWSFVREDDREEYR